MVPADHHPRPARARRRASNVVVLVTGLCATAGLCGIPPAAAHPPPAGPGTTAAPPTDPEARLPADPDGIPGGDPRGEARGPVREALRTFGADGAWLFAFPKRTTTRGAWVTAGVVAATVWIAGRDDEIRAQVLEHRSSIGGDLAEIFEPLGTYLVAGAGLGAVYLGGRAAGSGRLVSTTATAFEAWTWTAIITAGSKGLFGREPPTPGHDEDDWFDGGTIFPSGHTSRSFAIAAVFADRYGRRAAWIGYPIAGLVGVATLEQDTHWASDIVAGAALGLAIGRGVASRRRPAGDRAPGPGAPITWTFAPAPRGATLTITF
jgi:membrane-associated phospholipid phosphatase